MNAGQETGRAPAHPAGERQGPEWASAPWSPHMLRADRLGQLVVIGKLVVPHVTDYEDGTPDGALRLNRTAPGGPRMDCGCVFGRGRPKLGSQCPVRQRRAVSQRRCNTCGLKIKGPAVFMGIARQRVQMLADSVPTVRPISTEAPTHPECVAYSAFACPAFRPRPQQVRMAVVDRAYPIVDRWIVAYDRGPDDELVPVYRYAPHGTGRHFAHGLLGGCLDHHVALLDEAPRVRHTTLAEWMREEAPQPYRELWARRGHA